MKKRTASALGIILAIALICVCVVYFGNTTAESTPVTPQNTTPTQVGTITVEYDDDDLDAGVTGDAVTSVALNGDSVTVDGSGATVNGSTLTIASAGTYSISGTLNDGQIRVDTDDEKTVRLVLDGANISCSNSAPIYVVNAGKTVITLADGTENAVSDGDSYVFEDAESDEPNAAIFSKDDLTINGNGSLTVDAHYNNGIQSKDDLKITGGTIAVNAVHDGIKGKDSVAIRDGTVTVQADGDGIQSTNDKDAEKGYVAIEGGTIAVNAGTDGIQAETSIVISGGTVTVSSGGGSATVSTAEDWGRWGETQDDTSTSSSAKGIKAGGAVTISGGMITIDSSDDSVHSNGSMAITGGNITLASGDDGMHADSSLEVDGGEITITQCYEGLESTVITINGGTIHIVARDDGINVAGGNDGSSINGRPGQNTFEASDDCHLYINSGYIVIDASGDGLDSNGSIDMTGGTVIVNGPTDNGNGPIDYNGAFKETGGLLVAAGSSGMAQAPGTASTQYSLMVTYSSAQAAGTMVHIEDGNGEDVLTFVPTKTYQSVVLCSPDLKKGSTCTIYSGGNSTGTATDGLYSGGTYTPGTEVESVTVSDIVTYAGSSAANPSGAGPAGGGGPGGMPGGDGQPPSPPQDGMNPGTGM